MFNKSQQLKQQLQQIQQSRLMGRSAHHPLAMGLSKVMQGTSLNISDLKTNRKQASKTYSLPSVGGGKGK